MKNAQDASLVGCVKRTCFYKGCVARTLRRIPNYKHARGPRQSSLAVARLREKFHKISAFFLESKK